MFPALRCAVHRHHGETLLVVRGRLDRRTLSRISDVIWRRAMAGDRAVTVDLSRLSHFDSETLLSLLGIERLAERQLSCEIDLTGLEEAARRLTGVDRT